MQLWQYSTIVCCAVLAVGSTADLQAEDPTNADVAEAMTSAALDFLDDLNDEQKAKVVRPYEDAARLDWHNIPKPERKGLQIRDMSPELREKCKLLLQAALSDSGFVTAERIMSLEANLKEGEKGLANSPLRDTERYFLSVFGTPALTGVWGWSFEGHHLSLNFVVREGQVISASPSFWGANPATVKVAVAGGPDVGVRTLAAEEQLAFDLVNSLDAAHKKQAIVAEKAPADYRAGGIPQPPSRVREGVAVKELSADQQKVLMKLLETYCGHLAPALANARIAEIQANGWDEVYFAWAGGTEPGIGHYYRIEGPSFILELVNVQSDPAGNPANHIHSVWRDPRGDFGLLVKE